MDVFADVIRDHLELKRRRGADPAEVARLELEALGAVSDPEPFRAVESSRQLDDWAEPIRVSRANDEGAFSWRRSRNDRALDDERLLDAETTEFQLITRTGTSHAASDANDKPYI